MFLMLEKPLATGYTGCLLWQCTRHCFATIY